MLWKGQVACILLLLISFSTLPVIVVYNIPIAAAQNNNANFLTHINTKLGFAVKYRSNWTVNNSNTVNGHKVVSFASPDKVGIVFVQIENATQREIAVYNMNDLAKTNTIRTHLTPGERLLELANIIVNFPLILADPDFDFCKNLKQKTVVSRIIPADNRNPEGFLQRRSQDLLKIRIPISQLPGTRQEGNSNDDINYSPV